MSEPNSDWLMMGCGDVYGLESSTVSLASHTAGTRHSYNVTRTRSSSLCFLFCFLFMLVLFSVRFSICWAKMASESPRFTYVLLINPSRKKEYYLLLSNCNRSLWIDCMTWVIYTWSSHCGQGDGNRLTGWDEAICLPPYSPWIKLAPLKSHRSRINKGQIVVPQFSF